MFFNADKLVVAALRDVIIRVVDIHPAALAQVHKVRHGFVT